MKEELSLDEVVPPTDELADRYLKSQQNELLTKELANEHDASHQNEYAVRTFFRAFDPSELNVPQAQMHKLHNIAKYGAPLLSQMWILLLRYVQPASMHPISRIDRIDQGILVHGSSSAAFQRPFRPTGGDGPSDR